MNRYEMLTREQLESVCDKIGGERVVCGLLNGTVTVAARKVCLVPETTEQTCEVFSGCRCSICGGYFADGDDVCANGHTIGKKYEKAA